MLFATLCLFTLLILCIHVLPIGIEVHAHIQSMTVLKALFNKEFTRWSHTIAIFYLSYYVKVAKSGDSECPLSRNHVLCI